MSSTHGGVACADSGFGVFFETLGAVAREGQFRVMGCRRFGIRVDSFSDVEGRVLLRGALVYDVEKHPRQMGADCISGLIHEQVEWDERVERARIDGRPTAPEDDSAPGKKRELRARYRLFENPLPRVTILLCRSGARRAANLRAFGSEAAFWARQPTPRASVMMYGTLAKGFKVHLNKKFNVKAERLLCHLGGTPLQNTPALFEQATLECLFRNEAEQSTIALSPRADPDADTQPAWWPRAR